MEKRNLGDDDLEDTVARWLRRLGERYNPEPAAELRARVVSLLRGR